MTSKEKEKVACLSPLYREADKVARKVARKWAAGKYHGEVARFRREVVAWLHTGTFTS